jgi:hypothetical protein
LTAGGVSMTLIRHLGCHRIGAKGSGVCRSTQ